MSFNPFDEKPTKVFDGVESWAELYPKSYDKNEVSPYTKCRIILMNGTEYEAVWFLHQFYRHCSNNDLRREIAMTRRIEQQQQKKISCLKPIDESILEHTIAYEQLAVDLTCALAKNEPDTYVKQVMDFALLEDFDHLYRYADLLEMDMGIKAEKLVGKYAELMPGRPTIAEHRHPFDAVKYSINNKTAAPITKLHCAIITAAEQQTMNYYMNNNGFYKNDLGRRLYQEIGMIEEQHVSEYGSLMDPNVTWLECMLMHEYTECYLYYSCMKTETDKNVAKVWERHLEMEIAHLHNAARLLKTYEKKEWQEVIPDGTFPKLLELGSNIDYVREQLKGGIRKTSDKENYVMLDELPEDHEYFLYNNTVNANPKKEAAHDTIEQYIKQNGEDYRFETRPHPVEELRNRKKDNIDIARVQGK